MEVSGFGRCPTHCLLSADDACHQFLSESFWFARQSLPFSFRTIALNPVHRIDDQSLVLGAFRVYWTIPSQQMMISTNVFMKHAHDGSWRNVMETFNFIAHALRPCVQANSEYLLHHALICTYLPHQAAFELHIRLSRYRTEMNRIWILAFFDPTAIL